MPASTEAGAEVEADGVEDARQERAAEQAAEQRGDGRVGGVDPTGKEFGPEPPTDRGAGDEPGERQRALHEPELPADRGHREHEDDDRDVEAAHC